MPNFNTDKPSSVKSFLRPFEWTVALIFIFGGAFYLWQSIVSPQLDSNAPKTLSEEIRLGTAPMPTITEEMKIKNLSSKGFQALLLYSDSGFEPSALTIKAGDTVRLSNVSSDAISASVLSQTTVRTVAPMAYWEHTFDAAGSYVVSAGSSKANILVQ